MTDLPAPLTPPDCDLQNFPFMPLDFRRMFKSEWWVTTCMEMPAAAAAAVNLWGAAWQQVPAGSLPKNDTLLLRYSMLDSGLWKKVRARVLSPWVECSDGRLYHPVVAEKAREAMAMKRPAPDAPGGRNERQKRWRERQKAMSALLRENGVTPPQGASLAELESLLRNAGVDVSVDAQSANVDASEESTVDAESVREMRKTRTRTKTEIKKEESIQPTIVQDSTREDAAAPLDGRMGDDRSAEALALVADAAGLALTYAKRKAALAHVAGWMDGWPGCDPATDLVAPIRAFLAGKDGPTHSLARFDKLVLDRKARAKPKPPASAKSGLPRNREGEAERKLRAALRDAMGEASYAAWIDPAALVLNCESLTVACPGAFHADQLANHHRPALMAAARAVSGSGIASVIITSERTAA